MFELSAIKTADLINIIGIICTIITIILSIHSAKTALKNALEQKQKENSLKRIDELPYLVECFINSIKGMIIYFYVEKDAKKHEQASTLFNSTLPRLQHILIMYGSKKEINLFLELKKMLTLVVEGEDASIADVFALLMLLTAQIRQELTGDSIELKNFIELLIPELHHHLQNIYISAESYISKFELDNIILA